MDEIDKSRLTEERNNGCDGSHTKFTDASGKIRKFVADGGEGGLSSTGTSYYSSEGKLLFHFEVTAEEREPGRITTTETRVYFDDQGRLLWAVERSATAPAEVTNAPHQQVPGADMSFPTDPAALFPQTGCAP